MRYFLRPIGEVVGMGVGEATANRAAGIARWAGQKSLSGQELPLRGAKVGEGISQGLQDTGQDQNQ